VDETLQHSQNREISRSGQNETAERASLNLGFSQRKVVSALGHNTLAAGLTLALTFTRSVILARLLTPEAFGLFGIASMTIAALSAVSNFNLSTLLITIPFDGEELKKRWLDSVWVIEIFRSGLIFVAVWAVSSLVCNFYGTPKLYPLLITASAATLIAGFANSAFTLYARDIEYRRVVILEQLTAVVSLCATAGLTFWRRDAIVFAWGMVFANTFNVVMSYAWHKYRPTCRFDMAILRKCLGYGKYFLVVSVLTFTTTQFDNLVVGKYMGLAKLGIYLLAYRLAMVPVDLMLQVVTRVAVPTYAKLYRENPGSSFETWSTNLICLGWVFATSTLVLWSGGDYLISLLYGPNWRPPAVAFYALVAIGLFRGLAHGSGGMVVAMNRPDVDARAKTAESFVFGLLVVLLTPRFGMSGAAFAGLACYLLAFIFRTSFLLSVRPKLISKLAKGFARLVLGFVIVILLDHLLAAFSMPIVIRIGLIPVLVLCSGTVLEPLLREYVLMTFRNTVLANATTLAEAGKRK